MQCKPQDLHAETFILDIRLRILNGDFIQFYIKIRAFTLLTFQHSQSFLEGFQVFHWKLLLTGPAILSLLLPSCQTKKTNNWEVTGSLSQPSPLSPLLSTPLLGTDQDQHRSHNAAVACEYSDSLQLKSLFFIYILQRVFYGSIVFSSIF